jgi:hypothetical protein
MMRIKVYVIGRKLELNDIDGIGVTGIGVTDREFDENRLT